MTYNITQVYLCEHKGSHLSVAGLYLGLDGVGEELLDITPNERPNLVQNLQQYKTVHLCRTEYAIYSEYLIKSPKTNEILFQF